MTKYHTFMYILAHFLNQIIYSDSYDVSFIEMMLAFVEIDIKK